MDDIERMNAPIEQHLQRSSVSHAAYIASKDKDGNIVWLHENGEEVWKKVKDKK